MCLNNGYFRWFWNATLEELKQGYLEESDSYTCLLCGEKIEKESFTHMKDFYMRQKGICVFIEGSHQSVFDYLIDLIKLTGLTDHQNQLIRLFLSGQK